MNQFYASSSFSQPKYFFIDVLVELLKISFIDERVMLSNIVTQLSLVNTFTFRLSSFWNASTNLPTVLLILHSNVPSFVSNDTNVASLSASLPPLQIRSIPPISLVNCSLRSATVVFFCDFECCHCFKFTISNSIMFPFSAKTTFSLPLKQ